MLYPTNDGLDEARKQLLAGKPIADSVFDAIYARWWQEGRQVRRYDDKIVLGDPVEAAPVSCAQCGKDTWLWCTYREYGRDLCSWKCALHAYDRLTLAGYTKINSNWYAGIRFESEGELVTCCVCLGNVDYNKVGI